MSLVACIIPVDTPGEHSDPSRRGCSYHNTWKPTYEREAPGNLDWEDFSSSLGSVTYTLYEIEKNS